MSEHATTLDDLVVQAQAGLAEAREALVQRIQGDVYRMALKMLWHPDDAQDASQEILIRVVTQLGRFRRESSFRTWVYRIAANLLLTTRKRCAEQNTLSFTDFGEELADGLSDEPLPGVSSVEQELLAEEVKRGCTQAMLLCLDRDHRLAYILGEILELTGEEGGRILEISPAAFRKRLSRARAAIRSVMQQHCGLVNPLASCRCHRRVRRAVELGRVDVNNLRFAAHPLDAEYAHAVERSVHELELLEARVAALQRHPVYRAPDAMLPMVQAVMNTATAPVFIE